MNPKTKMSFDEIRQFFSATDEFTITKDEDNDDYLILSYSPDEKREETSSGRLMKEHICIQYLLRKIKQLVWNHCNKIWD